MRPSPPSPSQVCLHTRTARFLIYIPIAKGSPWIWADDRGQVKQVPLDAGVQYIHHNASKMGTRSPMLPLFAAIDALHDDFAYKDLDLVTDRNGLRKLLRYIDNANTEDNFRIDVDLVGKTVVFTRQEENTEVVRQNTGYGNEYLKATTREPPGCEKMLDHHRIITYVSRARDLKSPNVLTNVSCRNSGV